MRYLFLIIICAMGYVAFEMVKALEVMVKGVQ